MDSRQKRIQQLIGKWALYSLLLVGCAVLQTIPGLLQIGAVKPVFILPLCVAIAAYEGEFAGAIFGMLGGLMWDYTAGVIVGIFAILLLVVCFLVSLTVQLYLQCTRFNYFLICVVCNLVVLSIHFMFFYYMPGYHSPWYTYGSIIVPMAFYGALLSLPLFLLVRKIVATMGVNDT